SSRGRELFRHSGESNHLTQGRSRDFRRPYCRRGACPRQFGHSYSLTSTSDAMDSEAVQALNQAFGFADFREGQEEVIASILARHDVLAVMPTGSGKSLCYQLPALLFPGITLVVSPLIALMKDQVDALVRRGIPASFVNSTLSLDQQQQRIAQMRDGR